MAGIGQVGVEAAITNHHTLSMSPNPARVGELVSISVVVGTTLVEVKLMDAFGRLLRSGRLINTPSLPLRLPVQDLAAGVYFVQIVQGGRYSTLRLIIQ